MSELNDDDKKMVAGIIGEKMQDEFRRTLEMMKDKSRLADARYELTQNKLDAILAFLEKFDKDLGIIRTRTI